MASAATAGVVVALVATLLPRPALAAPLEFLYVEPNSGSSSGGHVALGTSDSTYHFQHHDDGTIRLQRTDAASFDFTYRALENRAIEAIGIGVDADEAGRIRDRFELRLLAESRVFENDARLDEDEQLLAWLSRAAAAPRGTAVLGDVLVGIPAAGYFAWSDALAGAEPDSPLAGVRRAIESRYGAEVIARRAEELRAAIVALRPPTRALDTGRVAPDRVSTAAPGFAERYRVLATNWAALELLRAPRPLAGDALVAPGAAVPPLSDAERARLRAFEAELVRILPALFESSRDDWGAPLLIGLARLLAIETSLGSGEWRVLDSFAGGAPIIGADVARREAPVLARVAEERRRDLEEARRQLVVSDRFDEALLSHVERAASLAHEIGRAATTGAAVRRLPETVLPIRPAWPPAVPMPGLSAEECEAGIAGTHEARRAYREALDRAFRYDLFERNCVTEVFRTIDGPGAKGATRLDHVVDATAVAGFVPAVAAARVAASYPVAWIEHRPSFREVMLARPEPDAVPVWREVRESNVFSARSYASGRFDEPFVFFTAGNVASRPVLGAVNLVVGVSAIAAGVLAAPFDGGAVLGGGFDAALFSLPELVFGNVRKGSYAILPQDWERWPG